MQLALIRVVVDHQIESTRAGEGSAAVPDKQIQSSRAVEVLARRTPLNHDATLLRVLFIKQEEKMDVR